MQIFTIFVVHAYSSRIWKQPEANNSQVSVAAIEHGFHSPEGHSKLIMDGPWTLLWPCMLLWPWFQAAISFGWLFNAIRKPLATAALMHVCVCALAMCLKLQNAADNSPLAVTVPYACEACCCSWHACACSVCLSALCCCCFLCTKCALKCA